MDCQNKSGNDGLRALTHSGKFPCFFQGFLSCLSLSSAKALLTRFRVECGCITSFVILDMGGSFIGVAKVLAVQNFHRAFGAHHGDLRGRPRIVDIAAQMLRRHHAISPAISFAGNNGNFWHCRLAKGIKQFRAMFNHTAKFLARSRQETRHIDPARNPAHRPMSKSESQKRHRSAHAARPCARRHYRGTLPTPWVD